MARNAFNTFWRAYSFPANLMIAVQIRTVCYGTGRIGMPGGRNQVPSFWKLHPQGTSVDMPNSSNA